MKLKKQAINFEAENWNYLVIGYYEGLAIVKNEAARLYYIKCEENEAPVGTVISEGDTLTPIEKLSATQQQRIEDIYGTKAD